MYNHKTYIVDVLYRQICREFNSLDWMFQTQKTCLCPYLFNFSGPTQADEIDENDENMDTSNVQESTDATNQAEAGKEENAAAGDIIKEKMHKFPLGTIKKIMKMDPDVNMASKDAIYLVTKSLEMFVESLAIEAYSNTVNAKKKTISRQDVEKAIDAVDALAFLDGAIDD